MFSYLLSICKICPCQFVYCFSIGYFTAVIDFFHILFVSLNSFIVFVISYLCVKLAQRDSESFLVFVQNNHPLSNFDAVTNSLKNIFKLFFLFNHIRTQMHTLYIVYIHLFSMMKFFIIFPFTPRLR